MKSQCTATTALLVLCLACRLAADGIVAGGAEMRRAAAWQSPEVTGERRVIFRLQAPAAQRVVVTGDFGERIELTRNVEGIWTGATPPLRPDIYGYNFFVDGLRTIDPRNPAIRALRPSGESVVVVRGESPQVFEVQEVPHGTVHLHWYRSTVLDEARPLYVYTPPGYEEGARSFPVVYLLHGAGEEAGGWVNNGPLAPILDNLIARGQARPMVVVMPLGHVGGDFRAAEAGARVRAIELFGRELRESVMPFVEERYRTSRGRRQCAIAGLSMGGAQALRIGAAMSERFGVVGAFGAAIPVERPEAACPNFFRDNAGGAETTTIWLGCGRADPLQPASRALRAALSARGLAPVFFETDGGHTWVTWRACLITFLSQLFTEEPRVSAHGQSR